MFIWLFFRKLLREHQLDAVTKVAQKGELERRQRLEDQRKQDFPLPLLPEYTTGEMCTKIINPPVSESYIST